ncbi:PREDICTED: uncharacterized protein LOC108773913 [Cyphomyrmex costatus]|uniref:uncharacterized protein LOC108773913 n=1 Tax=Cyphomyrmex costatus TaxID=456900 RepID=UPI0008523C1B|nr:PREDICTED: uncharacterized protein LOC108773913 [Cyphomyrmex costatus]
MPPLGRDRESEGAAVHVPGRKITPGKARALSCPAKSIVRDRSKNRVRGSGETSKSSQGPPRQDDTTRETGLDSQRLSQQAYKKPWSTVVGRKAKRKEKHASIQQGISSQQKKSQTKTGPGLKRKPPKSAAVQITAMEGASYADTLRLAKSKINIGEMGITNIKPRRAKTGALLLEISGQDKELKADELASKLEEVFQSQEDIKISRPAKLTEIRLVGLDDAVTSIDILAAVALQTACNSVDIKTGPIRQVRNRMGSTVIKCPIVTANKLIDMKKILIGWSTVRIVPLPVRRQQCHRCWEYDHVKAECKSSKDRIVLSLRGRGPLSPVMPERGQMRYLRRTRGAFQPSNGGPIVRPDEEEANAYTE